MNGIGRILRPKTFQPHRPGPARGNDGGVIAVGIPAELVAKAPQIPGKGIVGGTVGDGLVHIPTQNIPVGQLALLMGPVGTFFSAIELCLLQHRLPAFSTNVIGDLPEAVVVGNMVLKLPAGLEGYGVQ